MDVHFKSLGRFVTNFFFFASDWEVVIDLNHRKGQSKTKIMWRKGIPVSIRGLVWKTVIGNSLGLNEEIFEKLQKQVSEIRKKQGTDEQSENQRLIGIKLTPLIPFINVSTIFFF